MYLRSKTQGRLRCQKRRSLPQPVKIPQNHFHEYRQKVTVTTLFQTASHPDFQLLAQTAHVCFHSRKRVHTRLSEKNRTQGHTRRNRGVLDGGGITTLGAFRTFTNIPGPGIRTAYFAAFWPWSGVFPKNAESLRDSDAFMRVAVPRRRGPAGLRDPIAVSLTAPMGFAVLSGHDNSMQRKMLAGFTRWSAPCVLPLAAVPLLCPQHPSAADKTGQWKTG